MGRFVPRLIVTNWHCVYYFSCCFWARQLVEGWCARRARRSISTKTASQTRRISLGRTRARSTERRRAFRESVLIGESVRSDIHARRRKTKHRTTKCPSLVSRRLVWRSRCSLVPPYLSNPYCSDRSMQLSRDFCTR